MTIVRIEWITRAEQERIGEAKRISRLGRNLITEGANFKRRERETMFFGTTISSAEELLARVVPRREKERDVFAGSGD